MTADQVQHVAKLAAQGARDAMDAIGIVTAVVPLDVVAGFKQRWVPLAVDDSGAIAEDQASLAGAHLATSMIHAGVRAFMPLGLPAKGCVSYRVDTDVLSLRAVYQFGYDVDLGDLRPMLQVAMAGVPNEPA